MGKIEDLAERYYRHVCVPWQRTVAGAQRVVIVVYDKSLERAFRARKAEFALRTDKAGRAWVEFDCTRAFAGWMAADEYRDAYFESPADLAMKEGEFREHVIAQLRERLRAATDTTVVGMTGVGSLYGFVHIHEIVRAVEPDIRGRLVVFFPGSKVGNNFRLLDARDGWNYLATTITLDDEVGAA
jgi:hypothetical protein